MDKIFINISIIMPLSGNYHRNIGSKNSLILLLDFFQDCQE